MRVRLSAASAASAAAAVLRRAPFRASIGPWKITSFPVPSSLRWPAVVFRAAGERRGSSASAAAPSLRWPVAACVTGDPLRAGANMSPSFSPRLPWRHWPPALAAHALAAPRTPCPHARLPGPVTRASCQCRCFPAFTFVDGEVDGKERRGVAAASSVSEPMPPPLPPPLAQRGGGPSLGFLAHARPFATSPRDAAHPPSPLPLRSPHCQCPPPPASPLRPLIHLAPGSLASARTYAALARRPGAIKGGAHAGHIMAAGFFN